MTSTEPTSDLDMLAQSVATLPTDGGSFQPHDEPAGGAQLSSDDGAEDIASDPVQTAAIAVTAADMACSEVWGLPLADHEREALTRDLTAVLRKHDVPNLPYQEEVALALTTGGIVYRRVKQKRTEHYDSTSHRQERERQEYIAETTRVAASQGKSAVDDLLS